MQENYPSTHEMVGDLNHEGGRVVDRKRERVTDMHGNTIGHKVTTYVVGGGRSFPASDTTAQRAMTGESKPWSRNGKDARNLKTRNDPSDSENVTLRIKHLTEEHGSEFDDRESHFAGLLFVHPRKTKLDQVRRLLKSDGVVNTEKFDFIVEGAPVSAIQETKLPVEIFKDKKEKQYTCIIRSRSGFESKNGTNSRARQASHSDDMKRTLLRLSRHFGRGRMFNIFRDCDERESGKIKICDFAAALKKAFRREMTQSQISTSFACMDRIGEKTISFSDVEAYTSAVEVQSDIEVRKACEKLKKALGEAASNGFAIDVKMSDLKALPGNGSNIKAGVKDECSRTSQEIPRRFRVGDRVWYARLQTEGIVTSIDDLGKSMQRSKVDPRICRLKIIGGAAAVRNVLEDFDDDWIGRLSTEQFEKALSALGVKRGFDTATVKNIR